MSSDIASTRQTTGNNDKALPSSDSAGIGQMRGGLVFLKTRDRPRLLQFYEEEIGMQVWLEQPDITILKFGNLLIGLHHQPNEAPDISGMYTFVYPNKEEVKQMHLKLSNIADGPPRINERYRIYQFFAKDPEGRKLEFQAFLHPLTLVTSEVDPIVKPVDRE